MAAKMSGSEGLDPRSLLGAKRSVRGEGLQNN